MIRTTDAEYIRSVFCHPSIYPHISDDYAPPADQWRPVLGDDIHYLRPEEGGACFLFHPHSRVLWEVHSAVLPDYRGRSLDYVRACAEWLAQHTTCKSLMTLVPRGNVPALCLARAVGMRRAGTIKRSFKKNGELLDQHLLVMEIGLCQQ